MGVAGPSSTLPAAASFDTTATNYVLISNTAALNFAGPITLEAWVLPSGFTGLNDILAHGYDASQNSAEMMIRAQSANYGAPFDGGYYNSSQGGRGASGGTETGTWTHVVLTWDGTSWNLYLNGLLAGASLDLQGPLYFSDPWAIANGTASGNGRLYGGDVCAAAIYNHALTPAQVAAHYVAADQPPVITVPPMNSVVLVNSNVTMSVTAIGSQPLAYQWYNGYPGPSTLMTGAINSTLPFVNAQTTAAGTYFVVVTQTNGLAATNNSPGAFLTVVTNTLPGSYFTTVMSLNPIGYWPLNETNQPTPYGALNIGTLGEIGDAFWGGTNLVYR